MTLSRTFAASTEASEWRVDDGPLAGLLLRLPSDAFIDGLTITINLLAGPGASLVAPTHALQIVGTSPLQKPISVALPKIMTVSIPEASHSQLSFGFAPEGSGERRLAVTSTPAGFVVEALLEWGTIMPSWTPPPDPSPPPAIPSITPPLEGSSESVGGAEPLPLAPSPLPTITTWLPRGTSIQGGGKLRLYGTSLPADLVVKIGGHVCASPTLIGADELHCTIPPRDEGAYEVQICRGNDNCSALPPTFRYAKTAAAGMINYTADGWYKAASVRPGLPRAGFMSSSPIGNASVGLLMAPDGRLLYTHEYIGAFLAIDTDSGDYVADVPTNRAFKRGVGIGRDGYVYAAFGSGDVRRYRLTDGVDDGWIGKVAVSPSGGAATCAATAVGDSTPGWCTGGSSATGNGDGHFNVGYQVTMWADAGGHLFVPDRANHRIVRIVAATGQFAGWIGKVATPPSGSATGSNNGCSAAGVGVAAPGWCVGGSAAAGDGDGMLAAPTAVTGDEQGNLYVLDQGNFRIAKFAAATGAFLGWTGGVGTSPTGPTAGCTAIGPGAATPAWCTGGTGATGTADGHLKTGLSLQFAADHLYVGDMDGSRVLRYSAASGAFTGWIGVVGVAPTGGGAGCAGAAVDTLTPLWCLGGAAKAAPNVEPRLDDPRHVVVDASGDLYVAGWNTPLTKFSADGRYLGARRSVVVDVGMYHVDESTGMTGGEGGVVLDGQGHAYLARWFGGGIAKIKLDTGAFVGWIGRVDAVPTGGAAGCDNAAPGQQTPGWCKGGSAAGIAADQAAANLETHVDGIAIDDQGFIYGIGRRDPRIVRFVAATGAYSGWVGRIGVSPTGGDPGCAGAPIGAFTPGWCTGGAPAGAAIDGAISADNPYILALAASSSGHLYVTDRNRVMRYVAATGQFTGWIGHIGVQATGGDPGCAAAAVGSFTPGWCTGGSAADDNGGTGGLRKAVHPHVNDDLGYLYIPDWDQSAVNRYDLTTGQFRGWIGTIAVSPTSSGTGSPNSCAGAAVDATTPGWCVGGRAKAGQLRSPEKVADDGAGRLFVGSFFSVGGGHGGNDTVSIFDEASGAFLNRHPLDFPGRGQVIGVAPLPDGTIYMFERNGGQFWRQLP